MVDLFDSALLNDLEAKLIGLSFLKQRRILIWKRLLSA
jgi:hypothetical protein